MSDILEELRPNSLDMFVADSETMDLLKSILDKETGYHVFLLSGSAGVGKTSFAKLFAKSCNAVGTSDCIEVNCAVNRGIDDARQLVGVIESPPLFADNRVVILDEAHQLTDAAQNAFLTPFEGLKTNYVFLCSTLPEQIISTIRSRCFHVNLKPKEFKSLDEYDNLFINRMRQITVLVLSRHKIASDPALVDAIISNFMALNNSEQFSVRNYITFIVKLSLNFNNIDMSKCGDASNEEINKIIQDTMLSSLGRQNPILLARFLCNKEKHRFNWKHWKTIQDIIVNNDSPPETIRIMVLSYLVKVIANQNFIDKYTISVLKRLSESMNGPDGKVKLIVAMYDIFETWSSS